MNRRQSRPKTRSTIRDVAETTGVSPKTVSFVLNGKPGVSEETRVRVLKAVSDLEYYPHMGARALRSRVSRTVGVTFTASWKTIPLSRNLLFWLYEGLVRVFGSRGYYVTFDMSPHNAGGEHDYARGVWEQAFGPCILIGPLADGDQACRRLYEIGIPYVATGRLSGFPQCSSATVDYEEAAYLGTRHLIQKGHRMIAMLSAFEGYQPGHEREHGYRRAFEEAGLPVADSMVRFVNFEVSSIVREMHALLRDHEVTALIDASGAEDPVALREGAQRAGRKLSGDLETLVWTYMYDTAVLPEASAHMWLPIREATAEGFESLAAWIDGKHEGPVQVLYRPLLFERPTRQQPSEDLRLFIDAE
jgi:LacI family transcriptional regulator